MLSAIPKSTRTPPARVSLSLNNLTHLRLLFAGSVVLSHAATLTGNDKYYQIRVLLNSEAAVQGFFILSGFLVCGSYMRLDSIRHFYFRRLARIYPAYSFAVLFFLILALFQAFAVGAPVAWSEVPAYLAANLTTLNFLQPRISGVFENNYMHELNGALWSIKVEMMFYIVLPIIIAISRRTSLMIVTSAMIFVGAGWWKSITYIFSQFDVEAPLFLKFQLPGQLLYFGLGLALFGAASGSFGRGKLISITILAIVLSYGLNGMGDALRVAVLIILIVCVAALPQMRHPFGTNDISFGIYLSHFPIIQMLLAAGASEIIFPAYVIIVVVLVIGYGLFSWNVIERRALRTLAPIRP